MSIYSNLLKSPKWQKKRLNVLNRDNFTCIYCGDKETELHIHHLKYNGNPIESPLSDLQTVCKNCHYIISKENPVIFKGKISGKCKVYFLDGVVLLYDYKNCEDIVRFAENSEALRDAYKFQNKK